MGRTSRQAETGEMHLAREPRTETAGLSEKLLQATLAVSRCATLEEALHPLLDAALDITRMDGGGVYWVEGETAVLRHHQGLPQGFIDEVMCMPLTPPPVQTILHQREPVELVEISSGMQKLCRRHGIRHAFSFPLRARETVFGFLNVGSTRTKEPAHADLLALQVLVRQMEALFDRLHSARALRESEERYRTLWQSALDGMALYELSSAPFQGRLIDVNECTCRMLGYSREELLQRSPFDLVDDEGKRALPKLAAQVRQSGDALFEMTAVAKDGRCIPVEVKVSAVQFAERRVVLAVLRDVTERQRVVAALQESEEYFRAFMDNSPAVAWMKDEQGRLVYLSGTYEKRFGWRLEDCRGKTDFDLWPQEIAEAFRKNDQEVLRTGQVMELVEETSTLDGGRCYWWDFKFPFADASGRKYVGGIGVDITERLRLEEDLKRLNERLEEQVQARTRELEHRAAQLQRLTLELIQAEDRQRLAEFLHDDLQQTLAAVKFQLSIVAGRIQGDATAGPTVQHARQMLREAIEKARHLSHELGPAALFRGDLGETFEWLAGQMENRHGLVVLVDIREPIDSRSEAVRSFLYRAAQELLFDVAKHARVREARLRLQRVRDQLWLTISDKGCGFNLESLDKTAGYGLTSIRDRVEMLGGCMKIRSIPGRGSIFFLAIPDGGAGQDISP
jgi:PAS domain S-box-containing protein